MAISNRAFDDRRVRAGSSKRRKIDKGRRIDVALASALIISLPFFSLRQATFGYSITLLVLLVIGFRNVTRKGSFQVFARSLRRFDFLVLLYIVLGALSGVYGSAETYGDVVLRSSSYFVLFLLLKSHMSRFSDDDLIELLSKSAMLAILMFVAVAFAAVTLEGNLSLLGGGLSYWNFTYAIYGSLDSLFGGTDSGFESRSVMRNTIGEAFAFFALVIFAKYQFQDGGRKSLLFFAAACVLAILTFSRRSPAEIAAGVLILTYAGLRGESTWSTLLRTTAVAVAVTSAIWLMPDVENRFSIDYEGGRFDHYADAFVGFGSQVALGYGYGEKAPDGKYVHSFPLASLYMMGIGGLFIAFAIYASILAKILKGAGNVHPASSALLVIPIIGSSISSTVEGMFGPVAWTALAIAYSRGERIKAGAGRTRGRSEARKRSTARRRSTAAASP